MKVQKNVNLQKKDIKIMGRYIKEEKSANLRYTSRTLYFHNAVVSDLTNQIYLRLHVRLCPSTVGQNDICIVLTYYELSKSLMTVTISVK